MKARIAVANPREAYAEWVLPLCWTAILLDGFDLVELGAGLALPLTDQDATHLRAART